MTASPGHDHQAGRRVPDVLQRLGADDRQGHARTLGIARTKDLDGPWTARPAADRAARRSRSRTPRLYYEPANRTWFLFTNHIGICDGGEYTDAVWVYWTQGPGPLGRGDTRRSSSTAQNCTWSKRCIGLPSVVKVGERLAVFYDAPGGESIEPHAPRRRAWPGWTCRCSRRPRHGRAVIPSRGVRNSRGIMSLSFASAAHPFCKVRARRWSNRANTACTGGWMVAQAAGQLVMRGAVADPASLEQLLATHRERMTRLAYRLFGWSGEVEDVVQEVFLSALNGLGSFRGEADVATWLMTITVNKCRTWQRKRWLRARWFGLQRERPEDPAADRRSIDIETAARVREAVQALPAGYREVVVLRYLEELPTAQVARMLGISANTVDVRLHRARARLKVKLAGLWEQ